jgi:hypothetical protein
MDGAKGLTALDLMSDAAMLAAAKADFAVTAEDSRQVLEAMMESAPAATHQAITAMAMGAAAESPPAQPLIPRKRGPRLFMKGWRSTIKRLDPGSPRYMLGVRDERLELRSSVDVVLGPPSRRPWRASARLGTRRSPRP